jgi:hypothetical protein
MINKTLFFLSRVLLLFALLIPAELLNAQKPRLYDTEITAQLGMSVPTMNSRAFYQSPEKIVYKLNVSHFKAYKQGYTSGVQINTIQGFQEISVPLYISFRTIPEKEKNLYFNNITDLSDVAWKLFNFLVPQNVKLDAGPSLGYIVGNKDTLSLVTLNRRFVTSFDISAKFCYVFGPVSLFINPEFCFLATKNYAFNGIHGWKSPISYFKGSVGIGLSL